MLLGFGVNATTSSCIHGAEFFIALASSTTLLATLGTQNWITIASLVCDGAVAAPLVAKIAKKMNTSKLLLPVGILVPVWSFYAALKVAP